MQRPKNLQKKRKKKAETTKQFSYDANFTAGKGAVSRIARNGALAPCLIFRGRLDGASERSSPEGHLLTIGGKNALVSWVTGVARRKQHIWWECMV